MINEARNRYVKLSGLPKSTILGLKTNPSFLNCPLSQGGFFMSVPFSY
jgi:hypothetical protein